MFSIESLSKALKICLMAALVIGVLVTVLLSVILKRYFNWYFWNDSRFYWACVVTLTIGGLSSLNILWQLISLLKTIHQKNPFVRKNAACLKRIAFSSFVISVMFFVLLCFRMTLFVVALGYVFLVAGFSCIVFAGLFQKAVEYKDENDLTI